MCFLIGKHWSNSFAGSLWSSQSLGQHKLATFYNFTRKQIFQFSANKLKRTRTFCLKQREKPNWVLSFVQCFQTQNNDISSSLVHFVDTEFLIESIPFYIFLAHLSRRLTTIFVTWSGQAYHPSPAGPPRGKRDNRSLDSKKIWTFIHFIRSVYSRDIPCSLK